MRNPGELWGEKSGYFDWSDRPGGGVPATYSPRIDYPAAAYARGLTPVLSDRNQKASINLRLDAACSENTIAVR